LAYIPDRLGCLYGTLFSFSCGAERSNELDGWLRVQGRSCYRYMRGNCRQQLYRRRVAVLCRRPCMPAVRKVSCFSGCLLYRVAVGEELVWAAAAAGTASIIASTTLPACVCLLVVSQLSAVCPLRVARCLLCLSVVRSWIILRHVDSVFHCFPRCPVICVAGRQ